MVVSFASPFSGAPARRLRARTFSLLALSLVAVGCVSSRRPASRAGGPVTQAGSAKAVARLSDATLEQQVLVELNKARTNPRKYADYLESTIKLYDGMLLRRPTDDMPTRTREGVPAVREAIKVLRSMPAMSAFEISSGMTQGARDHVVDAGKRGSLEHRGSDGSMAWDRVSRYGRWGGEISENMSFGPETGRDVVAALIIDDGVPSRGHRKNIFDADVKVVGISCGDHRTYRRMCDVVHAVKYTEKGAALSKKQ